MRITRRRVLKGMVLIAATPMMGSLSSCTSFAPEEFKLGSEISPPTGCKLLRKEDPKGDC